MFWHIVQIVQIGTAVAATLAIIRMIGTSKPFLRGKIVSRLVVRTVGFAAAAMLQVTLSFVAMAAYFAVLPRASTLIYIFWNVWIIDDWVTGDDDRWRRYRDWAKSKLKKLKPVRLRPAERWAPTPA